MRTNSVELLRVVLDDLQHQRRNIAVLLPRNMCNAVISRLKVGDSTLGVVRLFLDSPWSEARGEQVGPEVQQFDP